MRVDETFVSLHVNRSFVGSRCYEVPISGITLKMYVFYEDKKLRGLLALVSRAWSCWICFQFQPLH